MAEIEQKKCDQKAELVERELLMIVAACWLIKLNMIDLPRVLETRFVL